MADRKITDLTALAAGSQATGDLLTIVDVSEGAAADKNKKITVESLFKGIPGNVGIGTASPALSIGSVSGKVLHTAGAGTTGARFQNTGGTSIEFFAGSDAVINTGTSTNMTFKINDSEKMRIDSSGRILGGHTSTVGTAYKTTFQAKGSGSNHSAGYSIISGNNELAGAVALDSSSTNAIRFDADPDNDRSGSYMRFRVDGSEKMRIDSSGRLGVGINSPGCQTGGIHAVHDATQGTPSFTGAEVGIFQRNYNGSQDCAVSIVSGTNASSIINFGDKDDVNPGIIEYLNGSNAMRFSTNAGERIRLLSGGGMTFNGDTAAANALDDYEEGSWTPTFQSGVSSPGYVSTFGGYTKIGRLVTFTLRMDATGTTTSSPAVIAGLPFTSTNANIQGGASFNYAGNIAGNSDAVPTLHVSANATTMTFFKNDGNAWAGNSGNGVLGVLHIHGFYYTD